ncbi:response regulator [Bacteroides sp.]|uniref:response regulator n=1 Tax=Bacteroides sp. TaxID=29523 RepID=UPI00260304F5|nr:response regulator [Bacteroides sp.]
METEKMSEDYRPLILVAEDDESNFKLIKAIIGKKCEILWAKNGEEIVTLFKENRGKAEAILMDIKMPIMNGLDATVLIRKEEKKLPIIMQTAYAFTADREKAMECGASEVLVKPITLTALRTCLSRYLPNLVW